MKKQNNTSMILLLSFLTLLVAFTVTAFSFLYKKDVTAKTHEFGKTNFKDGPIHFSTFLDNNYYYDNNEVYLLVDLKSDRIEASTTGRTPLNIALVIDKSGSMGEKNKLDYVKKAAEYIIEEAGRDDYVSIVTYDDYADVLQRSSVIRDKYDLKDKVNKLKPGGYTNLSEGTFEGYDQVNKSYSRGYVNRVFLLSDGLANKGITNRFELSDRIREKNRRDGITISTFGVGSDFNEDLMTDIADYGKGNYYYIRNSSDIPEIFADEMKGIRNLVGQGTKIKIKFPNEYLALNKVFGYPYDVSGNEVIIDLKDVFSGDNKSVLIKFNVKRKPDNRLHFESELTYEDVNSNFRTTTLNDIKTIEPANNKDEYLKGKNETVAQNITVFESNEMMENALREADNGNYDRAKTLLKDAKGYMSDQMQNMSSSPQMKQQSESMEKYDKDLENADTKSDEEKKEMQKSGKYDNYNNRKNK